MKGPTEKPPVKWRKIDKKTKVITDELYAQEIRQIHKKETQKKSMFAKQQKKSIKKKTEYEMSESTANSSNDQSEDENEIGESSKDKLSDPESENFCLEDKLVSLWGSLSPPTKEENLIQKWYGCIYENFTF